MSKCITISPVLSVLNTHLLFANPLNLWEKKLTTIKTGIYKDQQPTLNYGHFVSVLSVSFYFMLVIFFFFFKLIGGTPIVVSFVLQSQTVYLNSVLGPPGSLLSAWLVSCPSGFFFFSATQFSTATSIAKLLLICQIFVHWVGRFHLTHTHKFSEVWSVKYIVYMWSMIQRLTLHSDS